MNIKLNMDRILDYMIEADNNAAEYYRACQQYKKDHGYIACIDYRRGLSDEEKHIEYVSKWKESSDDVVRAIIEVTGFDQDQQDRLRSAYRGVKRWYEKETKWERCLPEELIERITVFVIG